MSSAARSPAPVTASASTVEQLRVPMPSDRAFSWLLSVAVTAVALVLRLVHLSRPASVMFDETYYAKDAYALLKFGYERDWPVTADASILAGHPDVSLNSGAFIVHPQVGKWLIAAGEQLFGMNPFGWRIAAAVAGSLLILLVVRLVRRLSRSTAVGVLAGLLLTFDGLEFVMSRTALLDIFLALFLTAAVSCLAADRDWFRSRLADHLTVTGAADLGGAFGPRLWWRPWRAGAGVAFGLALGTKWSAVYVLAAFALLTLAWDVSARQLAGSRSNAVFATVRDGVPAFVSLVVLGLGVYLATWTSWLATAGGYDRTWGAQHPDAATTRLLGRALASLLHYHAEIYGFHTGDAMKGATHPYAAHPAGWLVIARPTGFDAVTGIEAGSPGCPGPDTCLRVISGIGTPVLWWAAALALLAAVIFWLSARDWRFSVPVVGVASAWLPWVQYTDRPLFYFYAVAIIPFSVTALALLVSRFTSPAASRRRRRLVWAGATVFLVAVVANFAWLYPILTDGLLTYPQWQARMWFNSWI